MEDPIISTIRYADANNQALITEKAYILNYTSPPQIPKSNFEIKFFSGINIYDLRTAKLKYDENGITMANLQQCMSKEDFENEEKIENHYLPEVHRCIRETLGVEEVYIFDYLVRRREASFPCQPKAEDNAPQPALSAHIGKHTNLQ